MTKCDEIAIEAIDLTHYYNDYPAVDKISFVVPAGTVFGLLGPNGAGKSTTIKMLTTLLPPTFGTAKVLGRSIIEKPAEIRQHIGYVPQFLSADGDLTGFENLLIFSKLYGLPSDKRLKRIDRMLDFMGLSGAKDQMVNKYSGGMIRRLEIAQALLHDPGVLFLDEPTIGLDPAARKTLWRYLQEWTEQKKMTVLITTHDMDEADRLCDVVAFMHLGHIVAMDRPSHLKKSLGPHATLDDVFIHLTGTSTKEGGDYQNVKQARRTITRLE
jgi:ABC-2 type transport system ATP-binding protein